MKLTALSIKNFRLLEDVSLNIEDDITLIVGKNNTGKTSMFEVVKIFTSESAHKKVSFADFSQSTHLIFEQVLNLFIQSTAKDIEEEEKEKLEIEIERLSPQIRLIISFRYNPQKDKLADLNEFIVDLDKERTDVNILMTYEARNTLSFYSTLKTIVEKGKNITTALNDILDSFYEIRYYTFDIESQFKARIEKGFVSSLSRIVTFNDIRAQRVMDDLKEDSNHSLTGSFAKYYTDKEQTDKDVQSLEEALDKVAEVFKTNYNEVLKVPLARMNTFGAKATLSIPEIMIESEFSAEKALRQNIKYYYKNGNINLPENYNGLGYSNLIYIILEFMTFLKQFEKSIYAEWTGKIITSQNAKSLIILIEEPESHMHPQMQQVFIRGVKDLLKQEKDKGLDIQLIITTHSSHIIAEAGLDAETGFKQLRYFGRELNGRHFVRDFNEFQTAIKAKETFHFLRKYLTLHKCDLFFADKVIMVEGLTERLLMPIMIHKIVPSLEHEYITLIEIGGAYAHKFKEFLEFIQMRTLVITDFDSIKESGKKCPVNDANAITVSNAVLKDWIPGKKILSDLIACSESEKIVNDTIRVTYQNAEKGDDYIGRSFEESFIRANQTLLMKDYIDDGKKKHIKNLFSLFKTKKIATLNNPYLAAPSDSAKSNFAFDILCFDESKFGEWKVPNYIKEGLEWLANTETKKS